MPLAAAVLIDSAADRVFDYAVPDAWVPQVVPGVRVSVPLRGRKASGTVMAVRERSEVVLPDGVELKPLAALLDEEPLVAPKLLELARWIASYYLAPMEQVLRAMAPPAVRPEENRARLRRVARLAGPLPAGDDLEKLRRRAAVQAGILTMLGDAGVPVPVADLGESGRIGAALRALVGKGMVVVEQEEARRDPYAGEVILPSVAPDLTAEQMAAVAAFGEALAGTDPRPIVLAGVTGSGKTEVYLQAIQLVTDQGGGAIVLVPEIALTPQTVERFKARFDARGVGVGGLHRKLPEGKRFAEWRRIRLGEARVVVGPRSAVFAPVARLGIIVVDEEHESSYKQDTSPRYHARDVAVVRARMEGCPILLGSATPSLESWHNARTGKYRLVRMTHRIDHRTMPLVRVVDMRIESRKRKEVTILSEPLRHGIEVRLERKEQVILFLNRRGFARSLQCPGCGHVCQCPHCSVALTYHKTDDRLLCHVCGYRARAPQRCPSCGDPAIKFAGYGTQRAEEVVAKVFPQARIARLDSDSLRGKGRMEDTLRAFRTGRIDILLGTQMIAKGLDFPNVTLVGVLNADVGLNVPDFRAGERTFQLLTQVAGRAGRGEMSGEVVVQTFAPHSPAIQHARRHDVDGYAEQEDDFRRAFRFPPHAHVLLVAARSEEAAAAEGVLTALHRALAPMLPEAIAMGQPVCSPLAKAQDQFRFQLMLRGASPIRIGRMVRDALATLKVPRTVVLTVDVDACQLG